LLILAAGCAPGVGDVSGTVTYKGKGAAGATITFFDARNGAPSSTIAEDGSYSVKNVATGNTQIAIISPAGVTLPGMPAPKSVQVPEKYANHEKSGLTYQVKTGQQKHDIELTD
jgi:uncharacterized phage protein gp47/JayE